MNSNREPYQAGDEMSITGKCYQGDYDTYIENIPTHYRFYKLYTDYVARYSIDECSLDMIKINNENEEVVEFAEKNENRIKESCGFHSKYRNKYK